MHIRKQIGQIRYIKIEGFQVHTLNREHCERTSGGIVLLTKIKFNKYIRVLNGETENMLLCRLNKYILGKPTILGVKYIPPENSPYSSINIFDEIELEIANVVKNDTEVILTGNFNARTGHKAETQKIIIQTENNNSLLMDYLISQLGHHRTIL